MLHSIYRPFMLLILEPMCLNLCMFSAIILGIQYLFFGAFPLVFRNNHSFELWQIGSTFIGMSIGMVAAVASGPWYVVRRASMSSFFSRGPTTNLIPSRWRRNYQRLIREHEGRGAAQGESEPEYRLPPAIAGAPLVTIGLFWFAWTT